MPRVSSGRLVLAGSALVCVVLGSVHGFSVFLDPLETKLNLGRATVSLTYSFALVALTLTVLLGPKLYSAFQPAAIFGCVGVLGALGAMLAGVSQGIFGIWLGYSALFGVANGLGYGFSLQYAARANPNHSGVAMGIVTAAYALGAAVSPRAFVAMLEFGEFFGAMALLATATALACAVAAWFVWRAELPFEASSDAEAGAMPSVRTVVRTWLAYGLGVAAGLMAIGHAAGIASLAGITPWLAPAVLAVCNLVGSLIGGLLVDRFSPRRLLPLIPLISVLGLVMLAFSPAITLFALGLVGLAYGCTISAYPAVIAKDYPGSSGPRVYGLVFTAWGAAGLAAPWLAGALFDQTQSYSSALWIAAVLAATSSVLAIRLSRR